MTNPAFAFANVDEVIRNWNAVEADLISQRSWETTEDIRKGLLMDPISSEGVGEGLKLLREASLQTAEELHIPKPRSPLQPTATPPTFPREQTPLNLQKSLESEFSPVTNDPAFSFHYQDKDHGSCQASSQTPFLADGYPNIGNGRVSLPGVAIPRPIPPPNHSRRASLPGIAMKHPIPPRNQNRRASLPCTGSSLASPQRSDYLPAVDGQTPQPKCRIRRDSFPYRLHSILSGQESQEYIAWLPHGRAFRVLKQRGIEDKILSRFFKSRRYDSFQRQVCQCGMTECSCN
jgi:hypothetical protein